MLPGIPYRSWDPRETTLRTLKASVQEGEVQTVASQRAHARLLLMILAEDLRHGSEKNISWGSLSQRSILPGRSSAMAHASNIGLGNQKDLSRSDFCEVLARQTSLTHEQLGQVFDLMEYSGDGKISVDEFVVTLMAGADHLDDDLRSKFQKLNAEIQHTTSTGVRATRITSLQASVSEQHEQNPESEAQHEHEELRAGAHEEIGTSQHSVDQKLADTEAKLSSVQEACDKLKAEVARLSNPLVAKEAKAGKPERQAETVPVDGDPEQEMSNLCTFIDDHVNAPMLAQVTT